MNMSTILNSANRPVDLDDGRVLAPGEQAEVSLSKPHNKSLLNHGLIVEVEAKKPRRENVGSNGEESKS